MGQITVPTNGKRNSHLCTPSTCSLVKPLEVSPPPDSWFSLSDWAPLLSELSAGLLRYVPLPAELPFFVNVSSNTEGEREKLKINSMTNDYLQYLKSVQAFNNILKKTFNIRVTRDSKSSQMACLPLTTQCKFVSDFNIMIQYNFDTLLNIL